MAPGSAAVGPTRYGDRLLAAPIPTLWEPRRRAQTLQGRVAERAIGHQMARYRRRRCPQDGRSVPRITGHSGALASRCQLGYVEASRPMGFASWALTAQVAYDCIGLGDLNRAH